MWPRWNKIILNSIFKDGSAMEIDRTADNEAFQHFFFEMLSKLKNVNNLYTQYDIDLDLNRSLPTNVEILNAISNVTDDSEKPSVFDCFDSDGFKEMIRELIMKFPVHFPIHVFKNGIEEKLNFEPELIDSIIKLYHDLPVQKVIFIQDDRAFVHNPRIDAYMHFPKPEKLGGAEHIKRFFNDTAFYIKSLKSIVSYFGADNVMFDEEYCECSVESSEFRKMASKAKLIILNTHSMSEKKLRKLLSNLVPNLNEGTDIYSTLELTAGNLSSQISISNFKNLECQLRKRATLESHAEVAFLYEINRYDLDEFCRRNSLEPCSHIDYLAPVVNNGKYITINPEKVDNISMLYELIKVFIDPYVLGLEPSEENPRNYQEKKFFVLTKLHQVNIKMVKQLTVGKSLEEMVRDLVTREKLMYDICTIVTKYNCDFLTNRIIQNYKSMGDGHPQDWSVLMNQLNLRDNDSITFLDLTPGFGNLAVLANFMKKFHKVMVFVSAELETRVIESRRWNMYYVEKMLGIESETERFKFFSLSYNEYEVQETTHVVHFNSDCFTKHSEKEFLRIIPLLVRGSVIITNSCLEQFAIEYLPASAFPLLDPQVYDYRGHLEPIEMTAEISFNQGEEKRKMYAFRVIHSFTSSPISTTGR